MAKRMNRLDKKSGKPPGVLEYTGNYTDEKSRITLRSYNKDYFQQYEDITPHELKRKINGATVNWIEFSGLSDKDKLHELTKDYNIHHMFLEDALNAQHLSKYEEGENYIAVIMKAFIPDSEILKEDHISIILLSDTVIVLHEFENHFLDEKIERIKQGRGRARNKKADYLFYVLLDSYVDSYYLKLENLRNKLYSLEDDILLKSQYNYTENIHTIKKELTEFRKYISPIRETILHIMNDESGFIDSDNMIFFRDIKDHTDQLYEYYQNYNEMLKSLIDLNNSNINNSINSVMKVLTLIATVFIPLTFIAGIYGMNFHNMPELEWDYGYPVVLILMTVLGIGMFIYMKSKKWF
ncbi:MAG: magnesium/cobalt transporter CorA [Melioribacteraceae bacterium]|nr:magnesium/cobalt transporter CorA [Melioribacteraceae bacterium]